METTITVRAPQRGAFAWGAAGGVLGGLAFLPVMILLQPTLWARLTAVALPALGGTPAEFLGWLVHLVLLAGWGGVFALAYPGRDPRGLVVAALGWAFVLAWLTAMVTTLTGGAPGPLAWALETAAHAVWGLVLAGTLAFVAREAREARAGTEQERQR